MYSVITIISSYLNIIHVILFLVYCYGAYLFLRDCIKGENGLTVAITMTLIGLALGQLWAVLIMTETLSRGVDGLVARAFQLTFLATSLVGLIITNRRIQNGDLYEQD